MKKRQEIPSRVEEEFEFAKMKEAFEKLKKENATKDYVFKMIKKRLTALQTESGNIRNRVPKFSEKDIVWISETEQGIVKKVKGTWSERQKKVLTEYSVQVFKGNKKRMLVLKEKEISSSPEYFEKKKD